MNCLSVFDHFVGLALTGLASKTKNDENDCLSILYLRKRK